jgi:hypothetical protein
MNNIEKCIATLDACTAKLREGAERLERLRLKNLLRSEPSILQRWKRPSKPAHSVRTQYDVITIPVT